MFIHLQDYNIHFVFGNKTPEKPVSKTPEKVEPFHFSVGNKDFHTFLTTKDYLSLLAEVYTEYKLGNIAIAPHFEKEMTKHMSSPSNILVICNIIYQHRKLEYKHHAAFTFNKKFYEDVRAAINQNKAILNSTKLGEGVAKNVYEEIICLNYYLMELCGYGLFDEA